MIYPSEFIHLVIYFSVSIDLFIYFLKFVTLPQEDGLPQF